jgi:hypothetical protein
MVEAWCGIALHPSFTNGSVINQAKFSRKLILCAIALNNTEKAKAAFYAMSPEGQEDPLTRYLMFKVALLS